MEREMSTDQSSVMRCGWLGIKDRIAHSVDKRVGGKLNCVIPR